jgi:hypothetical protein
MLPEYWIALKLCFKGLAPRSSVADEHLDGGQYAQKSRASLVSLCN